MSSPRLLILFHSQSGATAQLARAAAEGAQTEELVDTVVLRACEAGIADLEAADAVLFGTPENLGYMSGAMKDFFDRTYYAAQDRGLALPYALFVSAGNDGTGAVREIDRILKGFPMRKVTEPVIVRGLPGEAGIEKVRDLGQAMAAGVAMGIF